MLKEMRSHCVAGEQYACIIDFTNFNPIAGNSEMRNAVSAELKSQLDFWTQYILCEARVSQSPVVRGIFTVFDWVTPLPWPCKAVGSGEVAELYVRTQLSKAGISAPPGEVWYSSQNIPQTARGSL